MTHQTRNIFYIFLLFGIITNVVVYFYITYSLKRKILDDISSRDSSMRESFNKLSIDTMRIVSDFVASNMHFSVVSNSVFEGQKDNIKIQDNRKSSPIYENVGSLDYHYFVKDGRHCAYIGSEVFSDGSPCPLGGVIDTVYPNCILLRGGWIISNSRFGRFTSETKSLVSQFVQNGEKNVK